MQVPLNTDEKIIASPLNFTGGKYKLLPQLLPLFPNNINKFIDLFCGGCNVAVNINAKKIICNDIDKNLIELLSYIQKNSYTDLYSCITSTIEKFRLSNSSKHGYDFYNCDTAKGLGSYNKEKFLALREAFNKIEKTDKNYYLYLYVLIIFSFNNQIRFNSENKFNLPVGKRDFNKKMQKKLEQFTRKLQNIKFTNKDFEKIKPQSLSENDFIYADPPYLITTATYNERGWAENDEMRLLKYLDLLSENKIRFALSNVLYTDGKSNDILKAWLCKNKKYKCHHLNFSYKNSSYHKKYISNSTDEVLIVNYNKE